MGFILEQIIFLFSGALITLLGLFIKWNFSRQEKLDTYHTAAIDKRLEIHQKAFALILEMQKGATPEKYDNTFNKIHKWWSENNFFLESHSRKAFQECYWDLLHFKKNSSDSQKIEKRLNFFKTRIPNTQKILSEEIGLIWLPDKLTLQNGQLKHETIE
jgi:hypothetical protein